MNAVDEAREALLIAIPHWVSRNGRDAHLIDALIAAVRAEDRQLLGYLWTATGKDEATRPCDLFADDDQLTLDILAVLERKP